MSNKNKLADLYNQLDAEFGLRDIEVQVEQQRGHKLTLNDIQHIGSDTYNVIYSIGKGQFFLKENSNGCESETGG